MAFTFGVAKTGTKKPTCKLTVSGTNGVGAAFIKNVNVQIASLEHTIDGTLTDMYEGTAGMDILKDILIEIHTHLVEGRADAVAEVAADFDKEGRSIPTPSTWRGSRLQLTAKVERDCSVEVPAA